MSEITEVWLKENGFKWHEVERSGVHWLLWMGGCIANHPDKKYHSHSYDDFGIELSKFMPNEPVWSVFYRADYAGRYSRFIYVREVWEVEQLTRLIEAITDIPFDKANTWYGSLIRPEQAARYREQEKHRLDRTMALEGRWLNDEKDPTKAVKK
jgi:hypothetical protein